jgi:CheY-like chemotaxis protein
MTERSPGSDGPQQLATSTATPPRPLDGLHVLIVDDDGDVRDVLSLAFELEGARVTACQDGLQALDAFEADTPDVLLMDINLPGPNGFTVMRMMRELHDPDSRSVPAIALSGSIESFGVERMVYAGFNEWFSKPVGLERLVAAVGRLARRAI